ncbi:UNKNOWN [Stylonychia lemnae]|uniref:Uncharacterized protein n=1 Tax=Stylonychia lemnae TaxID=5949 RepID=A0A078AIH9_STYLE|nr:UNKNOWN [Stylonychia lemnae]|eukprot:CDW82024.1 UNKNOWN [Stylonychia lemnae]
MEIQSAQYKNINLSQQHQMLASTVSFNKHDPSVQQFKDPKQPPIYLSQTHQQQRANNHYQQPPQEKVRHSNGVMNKHDQDQKQHPYKIKKNPSTQMHTPPLYYQNQATTTAEEHNPPTYSNPRSMSNSSHPSSTNQISSNGLLNTNSNNYEFLLSNYNGRAGSDPELIGKHESNNEKHYRNEEVMSQGYDRPGRQQFQIDTKYETHSQQPVSKSQIHPQNQNHQNPSRDINMQRDVVVRDYQEYQEQSEYADNDADYEDQEQDQQQYHHQHKVENNMSMINQNYLDQSSDLYLAKDIMELMRGSIEQDQNQLDEDNQELNNSQFPPIQYRVQDQYLRDSFTYKQKFQSYVQNSLNNKPQISNDHIRKYNQSTFSTITQPLETIKYPEHHLVYNKYPQRSIDATSTLIQDSNESVKQYIPLRENKSKQNEIANIIKGQTKQSELTIHTAAEKIIDSQKRMRAQKREQKKQEKKARTRQESRQEMQMVVNNENENEYTDTYTTNTQTRTYSGLGDVSQSYKLKNQTKLNHLFQSQMNSRATCYNKDPGFTSVSGQMITSSDQQNFGLYSTGDFKSFNSQSQPRIQTRGIIGQQISNDMHLIQNESTHQPRSVMTPQLYGKRHNQHHYNNRVQEPSSENLIVQKLPTPKESHRGIKSHSQKHSAAKPQLNHINNHDVIQINEYYRSPQYLQCRLSSQPQPKRQANSPDDREDTQLSYINTTDISVIEPQLNKQTTSRLSQIITSTLDILRQQEHQEFKLIHEKKIASLEDIEALMKQMAYDLRDKFHHIVKLQNESEINKQMAVTLTDNLSQSLKQNEKLTKKYKRAKNRVYDLKKQIKQMIQDQYLKHPNSMSLQSIQQNTRAYDMSGLSNQQTFDNNNTSNDYQILSQKQQIPSFNSHSRSGNANNTHKSDTLNNFTLNQTNNNHILELNKDIQRLLEENKGLKEELQLKDSILASLQNKLYQDEQTKSHSDNQVQQLKQDMKALESINNQLNRENQNLLQTINEANQSKEEQESQMRDQEIHFQQQLFNKDIEQENLREQMNATNSIMVNRKLHLDSQSQQESLNQLEQEESRNNYISNERSLLNQEVILHFMRLFQIPDLADIEEVFARIDQIYQDQCQMNRVIQENDKLVSFKSRISQILQHSQSDSSSSDYSCPSSSSNSTNCLKSNTNQHLFQQNQVQSSSHSRQGSRKQMSEKAMLNHIQELKSLSYDAKEWQFLIGQLKLILGLQQNQQDSFIVDEIQRLQSEVQTLQDQVENQQKTFDTSTQKVGYLFTNIIQFIQKYIEVYRISSDYDCDIFEVLHNHLLSQQEYLAAVKQITNDLRKALNMDSKLNNTKDILACSLMFIKRQKLSEQNAYQSQNQYQQLQNQSPQDYKNMHNTYSNLIRE